MTGQTINPVWINTGIALLTLGAVGFSIKFIFYPLSKRIDDEARFREVQILKLESALTLNAEVTKASLETTNQAIDRVTSLAEKLGHEHTVIALEQGRQAERIHYLSNEITSLGIRIERRKSPNGGAE